MLQKAKSSEKLEKTNKPAQNFKEESANLKPEIPTLAVGRTGEECQRQPQQRRSNSTPARPSPSRRSTQGSAASSPAVRERSPELPPPLVVL